MSPTNKPNKPTNKPAPKRNGQNNNRGQTPTGRNVSRGAALRAQKQAVQDANRVASQYLDAAAKQTDRPRQPAARSGRANIVDDNPRLKIIGLGGMDGGGSKNMVIVEYQNDAVIIDCGNDL